MKLTNKTGFDEHELPPRFIGSLGLIGVVGFIELRV